MRLIHSRFCLGGLIVQKPYVFIISGTPFFVCLLIGSMKLTDKQKKQIEEDLAAYTNEYAGKTKEERKSKGQFFTPASLVIKMLEMFDCEEPGDQTILDPTAGNGNLLVGALIAGFKPENVYGNELDPDIYEMLVTRLAKYGVPKKNLVNMDCLSEEFKEWCNV